jgi:hypothetical protein
MQFEQYYSKDYCDYIRQYMIKRYNPKRIKVQNVNGTTEDTQHCTDVIVWIDKDNKIEAIRWAVRMRSLESINKAINLYENMEHSRDLTFRTQTGSSITEIDKFAESEVKYYLNTFEWQYNQSFEDMDKIIYDANIIKQNINTIGEGQLNWDARTGFDCWTFKQLYDMQAVLDYTNNSSIQERLIKGLKNW